jgi:hypothetical protein
MNSKQRIIRSERGAVFVQIGISIFVLMAFNVFVLDYGAMWVSRRQAQNAADAGALAGAVARGYDDFDDPPYSDGPAADAARQVATSNLIWQQPGVAEVVFDCPTGVTGRCVTVDVYRNGERGNPLPTFFGPILGIVNQGVRATATAVAGNGNAGNCFRPIAFSDDWNENRDPDDEFNRYVESGASAGSLLSSPRDVYTAPSGAGPGSAYRSDDSDDLGERLIWELDRPLNSPITPGFLLALTLPGAGTFRDKLQTCSGQTVQLRQTLPVEVPPPGDTALALNYLMSLDPGVTWNDPYVENSCAPGCAAVSPRLIPIALFDPDRFQLGRATNDWLQPAVGCPTNNPCITVTNIVGFFVHGPYGSYGPHGHLLKYPGTTVSTAPTYSDEGSWLVTTHLVR